MSHSKFVSLDIYNNTDQNIPLSFNVRRNEPILDNQDGGWSVGISRFFIPSDLIKPYKDTSSILGSYQIGHYFKDLDGTPDKYIINDIDAKNGSIVDIMNAANYKLIDGYYNLIKSMGSTPGSGGMNTTYIRKLFMQDFANTIPFTAPPAASPNDSSGQAKNSTTIANINVGSIGHDIYSIKLKITKFQYQSMATDYPTGFELNLVAPSGKKCNVFTNQSAMTNFLNSQTKDWEFYDWNTEPVNINSVSGNFFPRELFSKLSGEDPNGDWKLELGANKLPDGVGAYYLRVEGNIEVMIRKLDNDQQYHALCPRVSPYVSLSTDDKVFLNYSEKSALTGLRVILSQSLNAVLKFPSVPITLDGVTYAMVEVPGIVCQNATPSENNSLQISQAYASSSASGTATDLFKLVFNTTLSITPTISAADPLATSTTITDYLLSAFDNEFYQYDMDYPNRMFELTSYDKLTFFNMQVYTERLDGSLELVNIMPNKRANIMLYFKKRTQDVSLIA